MNSTEIFKFTNTTKMLHQHIQEMFGFNSHTQTSLSMRAVIGHTLVM